jgi:predicted transcriptional regulator
MPAVSTSIKLDSETKDRVQRLAASRKRTAHWVMREAIEQYVAREETREAEHQDALKAWEDYKQTGLHLTLEEADKWLAELEAGNDIEPPACHV